MTEPAVRTRDLTKRFGAVTALRGVDLSVERGSACAVLGPNGAGKSTLLRILAGLARPSSGAIEIDGATHRGAAARARVGFVGHASLLYPELSARENLIFAGRLYGVRDAAARADALLDEEGLTEVAGRRAGDLSRGMSQRLSIGRARVHDPTLLLLDEPFTGLDARSAERLTARLRALRSDGRSLVVVTHELRQAADLVDSAVVLARGRVVHRAAGADCGVEPLAAALRDAAEAAA